MTESINNNKKIRVVAFCCKGRFQSYLLHRLNEEFELVGVVFKESEQGNQKLSRFIKYFNPLTLCRYLLSRLQLPKYEHETELRLANNYPSFISRQAVPEELSFISVENINDSQVSEFIRQLAPDIVCVNGTNLIREPLLSEVSCLRYGAVNLHTGLSPYSRGGNCNLHMLLEQQPQYVGATIHFIDSGIDSGNIIKTLRPELQVDDPYEYIEAKVFIDGIEALIKSVDSIAKGENSNVSQWQEGKLFLMRTGYHYSPYLRLLANKKIEQGLIKDYLANQNSIDGGLRLVE